MERRLELIAKKSLRYAGQSIEVGDNFEASEKDTRLLRAVGRPTNLNVNFNLRLLSADCIRVLQLSLSSDAVVTPSVILAQRREAFAFGQWRNRV